jgi:hypothetical protein
VHFTGASPAHLRFSGGVTISATIDADGATLTAGPGGCPGGTGNAAAGCGDGKGIGGNSGLSGAAGGGGGFGADGSPGTGSSGNGAGGKATGELMLTKLDYNVGEQGNRGNGGGGGGGATLGTAGNGGGGGGTIELTAGGKIVVMSGGAARSAGGLGTKGGGVGGGDAGGGSGGAILIRSGADVMATGTWITAPAGGNSGGSGGAGAIGRIRVDSPTGGVASMGNPTAQQGASWPVNAPTIVTTPSVSLSLIGGNGGTYGYFVVDGQAEMTKTLSGTTMSNVSVALSAGLNRVCAEAAPGASGDVAIECIDIAYVP